MYSICGLANCNTVVTSGGLCSRCKGVNYCSKDHQRSDWNRHKPECNQEWESNIASKFSTELAYGSLLDWARGMDRNMQMEWLVDCYRMRLDDEMVWQNSIRPGSLYDQSAAGEIAQDFLVFCCLAKKKGALPEKWSWPEFLDVAVGLLVFKFEKSDAKIKYGGENQFDLLHGGRSLRWVASAR